MLWRRVIRLVVSCTLLLLSFAGDLKLPQEECPFLNLQDHEWSIYSQNGEDGIIWALLSIVGMTNR